MIRSLVINLGILALVLVPPALWSGVVHGDNNLLFVGAFAWWGVLFLAWREWSRRHAS